MKNLSAVERVLQERNVAYAVHCTQNVCDAKNIARTLTQAGETEFIVIGGDGTLHEVLNGFVDPSVCKVGLIPCGSGNDFAARMGIPMNIEKATLRILEGEAQPVDYIDVSGTRCMNVAGLGMDVDVLERCSKGKMRGKFKYLMSLTKSFFAFKGYRVHFKSNDREEMHDVVICAACNGSQFGGGIRICPPADPTDGKMDIMVVDQLGGKMAIINAFIQLLKGKAVEYPLTTYFRTEQIRFESEKPVPIQLDGELYYNHEFEAKICKGLQFY